MDYGTKRQSALALQSQVLARKIDAHVQCTGEVLSIMNITMHAGHAVGRNLGLTFTITSYDFVFCLIVYLYLYNVVILQTGGIAFFVHEND